MVSLTNSSTRRSSKLLLLGPRLRLYRCLPDARSRADSFRRQVFSFFSILIAASSPRVADLGHGEDGGLPSQELEAMRGIVARDK